jgi:hypothetical protein
MTMPPDDDYEDDTVDLPPEPAAVKAVIMREPCEWCGESAFGYVTGGAMGALEVTAVTEYHEDACPVLQDGGFVIVTMPRSTVPLAGQITEAIFREDGS